MEDRNRRRRFPIINKSLQYRFLAMILSYGFIVMLFSALAFHAPEIIEMQDESLTMEARAIAADRVITLHTRVWFTALSMGLPLTKKLIELHGGRIWLESQGEGRGSTFTFVIPT